MNDTNQPDSSDFQNIGSDFTRHRAAKGWLKEAVGFCLFSVGLSVFDLVSGFLRLGHLTFPRLLSSVVFGIAITSAVAALRSLGLNTTIPEHKRIGWRRRIYAVIVLACLPLVVGGIGQIVHIVLSLNAE